MILYKDPHLRQVPINGVLTWKKILLYFFTIMQPLLRRALTTIAVTGLLITAGPIEAGFNPQDLPPDLRWVSVKNIPIVYSDQGQGDPLIILCPYPFSTGLLAELAQRLSAFARVIVVEPPGLRAPPSMGGDFSSEHLLQIYRRFIKTLGLNNVHIMGVGEAGGLAVAFGHHFPQHTTAVISINGFESVNWSEGFEGTINHFKQSAKAGPSTLLSLGSLRYHQQPPSQEEMEKVFVPLAEEEQREAVHARFEALIRDIQTAYIIAMLPNFNRQLLLLRAEGDELLTEGEKYVQRTRSQIRKVPVRHQVISQAGHFAFLDQSEKVAELIRAFLSENPISKGPPSTQ